MRNDKPKIIDIVTQSRKVFFHFVDECNENYRHGDDLMFYRRIIKMHRENNDLELLLNKDIFFNKIIETLKAFNMNQQGARLTSVDNFKNSVIVNEDNLIKLYKYKLHTIEEKELDYVIELLKNIFIDLKVMESRARIVGVSKAMHFLLPDLVMPIDRKYILRAFFGCNKYSDIPLAEFDFFKKIFRKIYEVTNILELKDVDVSGEKWNTSIPKLIDNAVIGWHKKN